MFLLAARCSRRTRQGQAQQGQGARLGNLNGLHLHHHVLEVIVGAVFKGKNPVGRCAALERQKIGDSALVQAVNGIGDFSRTCGEIKAEAVGIDQRVGEEAAIDLCAARALEGGASGNVI